MKTRKINIVKIQLAFTKEDGVVVFMNNKKTNENAITLMKNIKEIGKVLPETDEEILGFLLFAAKRIKEDRDNFSLEKFLNDYEIQCY